MKYLIKLKLIKLQEIIQLIEFLEIDHMEDILQKIRNMVQEKIKLLTKDLLDKEH